MKGQKEKGDIHHFDERPLCKYRGERIRTSDLLNPIQAVAGRKVAKASRFTAYKSYTSHILHSRTHKIHRSAGVSCSFLHFIKHGYARPSPRSRHTESGEPAQDGAHLFTV